MTRSVPLLMLFALLSAGGSASAQTSVTFAKDVAPIVYAKCGVCHRPGGSAPFSLLTYASARAHATQIAAVTRSGVMPPWKADGDYGGEFVGQPRLTAAETRHPSALGRGRGTEGDPAQTPPAAALDRRVAARHAGPDRQPSELHAAGRWHRRLPHLRDPAAGRRRRSTCAAWSSGPATRASCTTRTSASIAPMPRASSTTAIRARLRRADRALRPSYPDGHFLGWTPGQVPPLLPKGLAWRLEPNTDLVVELHMQPSGKAEAVQPTIGFYFGSDPPERTPAMLRLGRQNIDIPPGDKDYVVTDSFVLPVDVEVQAVQPHAHYRAQGDGRASRRCPTGRCAR